MAEGIVDPVELYRARSTPEAHAVRLALEAEGTTVSIENEHLQGALGELPFGWATAPRVIVHRADEVAAREILKAFPRGALPELDDTQPGIRCLACQCPMGDDDTCPQCGWTYQQASSEFRTPAATSGPMSEESQATGSNQTVGGHYPPHVWWEVAAVAAVAIVPYLIALPYNYYHPIPPPPYWLDTLHVCVLNACTVLVVLYLIGRSGESWEQFGVTRPWTADLFIAGGIFLGTVVLSDILGAILRSTSNVGIFTPPRSDLDHWLMFPKFASIGFTEELVMRCYLITRLSGLLRSRAKALLLAALLFASYHAYQGVSGTLFAFGFGLLYGAAFLVIRRVWPLALAHAMFDIRVELIAG